MRRRLQEATGLHRPDFTTYRFHIPLAYPVRWMPREEPRYFLLDVARIERTYLPKLSTIEFGQVEFRTFDDMHNFDTLFRIRPSGLWV